MANDMSAVSVHLANTDLWDKYSDQTTEMIITKGGRRMFPFLDLKVTGLHPEKHYFIFLEFELASPKRYKFTGNDWVPIGNASSQASMDSRVHFHADCPSTGSHWMSNNVSFTKVKFTNDTLSDNPGYIVLKSMHKYIPIVHIVQSSDYLALPIRPSKMFVIKEAEFISVTAYQNVCVTKLKIDTNPFAKGFRVDGRSRTKRKRNESDKTSSGPPKRKKYNNNYAASRSDDSRNRLTSCSVSSSVSLCSINSSYRDLSESPRTSTPINEATRLYFVSAVNSMSPGSEQEPIHSRTSSPFIDVDDTGIPSPDVSSVGGIDHSMTTIRSEIEDVSNVLNHNKYLFHLYNQLYYQNMNTRYNSYYSHLQIPIRPVSYLEYLSNQLHPRSYFNLDSSPPIYPCVPLHSHGFPPVNPNMYSPYLGLHPSSTPDVNLNTIKQDHETDFCCLDLSVSKSR